MIKLRRTYTQAGVRNVSNNGHFVEPIELVELDEAYFSKPLDTRLRVEADGDSDNDGVPVDGMPTWARKGADNMSPPPQYGEI